MGERGAGFEAQAKHRGLVYGRVRGEGERQRCLARQRQRAARVGVVEDEDVAEHEGNRVVGDRRDLCRKHDFARGLAADAAASRPSTHRHPIERHRFCY